MTTASELDADIAATEAGDGVWDVSVASRWNIGDKPNGGYLLALTAGAAARAVGHPDLLTASASFLRPADPGPARVVAEPLRAGRTLSTVAARLEGPEGRAWMVVTATFGDLGAAEGPTKVTLEPPDLPDLDDCGPGDPRVFRGLPMPFLDRLDTRFGPGRGGVIPGSPPGVAEIAAWTRLADGREPDWRSLLVHLDGLPPAIFNLGLSGWVPTIELSVYLRARPAPGWLRARTRTGAMVDGYLEESAELWDSAGNLVAHSVQLARAAPAS
jgi:hypothetical protein